jgi:Vms1-associating treble clef domain
VSEPGNLLKLVILTSKGPLVSNEDGKLSEISMFECFDLTNPASIVESASLERLQLHNRSEFIRNPMNYYDSLSVSVNDVQQEIDSSRYQVIADLSENPGILKSVETKKHLIYSAKIPKSCAVKEKTSYLVSAITLGIDGIFCGMLGPVRGAEELKFYLEAQSITGAPLVVDLPAEKILPVADNLNNKICLLNLRGNQEAVNEIIKCAPGCYFGFTCPCPETGTIPNFGSTEFHGTPLNKIKEYLTLLPIDRILLSSGLRLKPHFKQYGGIGMDFLFRWSVENFGNTATSQYFGSNPNEFLDFEWKMPEVKIHVQLKMWVCKICAKTENETVRNYTKMGNVYCSMSCLSKHRELGFS